MPEADGTKLTNAAIVIGVDDYTPAGWRLGAAVDDALAFAQWALAHGGVPHEDLVLLLSPAPGRTVSLPYQQAESKNIREVILSFQRGVGKSYQRLYFYYAGHGSSAPGTRGELRPEPVIFPSDVEDLARDNNLLLGFSQIMPSFYGAAAEEQFFFIDACRDFVLEDFSPALGSPVGRWKGNLPEPGETRRKPQYLVYATAPGQQAKETGRGVFGRLLLDALRGQPCALAWSQIANRYELRFSTIAAHVRSRMEHEFRKLPFKDWERYVQLPEQDTPLWRPDTVLMSFDPTHVEKVRLRVRVAPSSALPTCSVRVVYYMPGGTEVRVKSVGPPAPVPSEFELSPGDYVIVADADMYATARETCALCNPTSIDLKLAETAQLHAAPPSPVVAITRPDVLVRAVDGNALVVLWGPDRRVIEAHPGSVQLMHATPGIYRAQLVLPEGPAVEKQFEVREGLPTEFTLESPGHGLGDLQMDMLSALDVATDAHGYLHPSELLGGLAEARLASLLGFAAFAAHWPHEQFMRLKHFGVEPIPQLADGEAGLIVLVGASGEQPSPEVGVEEFLAQARVVARDIAGDLLGGGPFELLSGFKAAAQWSLRLPKAPVKLELRVAGRAPTHYALAALPGRVAVLAAVAEDDGSVDVQQYSFLPTEAIKTSSHLFHHGPPQLRRIEIAQRHYAAGRPIPQEDIDDLLLSKKLDPLLGCLAGYSIIQQGEHTRYIGHPSADPNDPNPEQSAMRNMLKFFGDLPDSHILAGLCEPEKRAEHFANAVQRGLPVFAEGFRVLEDWLKDERPPTYAEVGRGLLPGSAWTAWITRRPVILVRGGYFERPPADWRILEAHREEIESAVHSVGRIELVGHPSQNWIGTGFLVADDMILTTSFIAREFCENSRERLTQWRLRGGITAYINFAEAEAEAEAPRLRVTEVIGIDDSTYLALLRVTPPKAGKKSVRPIPLKLASDIGATAVGRKVYVVGYPARDARADAEAVKSIFGEAFGIKRLQPGEIIWVDPETATFHHDCFTLRGNAGSCVVDLETSRVVGLHWGGKFDGTKIGMATALWKLTEHPLFAAATVRFE